MSNKKGTLGAGLLTLIISIVFTFISVNNIKTYNEKNKTYTETLAVVVDYAYDDEGLQAIIVEYKVHGQIYRKQSNTYSNMPKKIGTELYIKYNPNNPSDAIWKSESTDIIGLLISGAFLIIGLAITIIAIKNKKEEHEIEENATIQDNGLYTTNNINNK